jgi:aminoglycoside phosphotransferase (APT) family kinase protein/RimJ/RimL family protein N-acetyltransferase
VTSVTLARVQHAPEEPSFDPQPTLKGALLELRPVQASDFDALYAVASDPLIWEQHPQRDRHEHAVFRAFFDEQLASGGALVVIDARTGEAIGMSRFHGYDAGRSEVEVGWTFLGRSYWGGVYNRELKELMLGHAFRSVTSVVFLIAPGNLRSRRAVEKLGAVEIGTRPDGAGRPSVVYAIQAPGTAVRMHADEVETDASLVRRLLASQFPQWAGLPIERVLPAGTDNAIYRVGDAMSVRLPRIERATEALEKECEWLPRLAPLLPLPVPVPLARGEPGEGYPWRWAVCRWLEGENATPERLADRGQAALDLAGFVSALQRVDATGGPGPGRHNAYRGVPLATRDDPTRAAIASLGSAVDADAASAAWDEALTAPAWDGPPTWIHGDLDSRNMLATQGRLSAVLDFGCLGVGDPAYDVMVAWKLLAAGTRDLFRTALAVDDATWARARGLALSQALIALGYYTMETNPVLVLEARRGLAEVLADRFRDP